VKTKYLATGAVVSAIGSGALAGVEWKLREEAEKKGIIIEIIPWSAVLPWVVGAFVGAFAYVAKNDSAKSFAAGSLLYGASHLASYGASLLTYSIVGRE
jgi:hypothetical protein